MTLAPRFLACDLGKQLSRLQASALSPSIPRDGAVITQGQLVTCSPGERPALVSIAAGVCPTLTALGSWKMEIIYAKPEALY